MSYSEIIVQDFFESVRDFPKKDRQMYRFAKRKHDDTKAVRKGSGEPYFVHPEAVAKIVIAYGGSDIEVKVALAHDIMEDTGATIDDVREKFGDEITDILLELTNDPIAINTLGKEAYINKKLVSISKSALFIKLADILHNSMDNCRPEQLNRMRNNIYYLIAKRNDLEERHWELIDSILEVMEHYK